MANGTNGYLRLPTFITVIAILTAGITGAYGFAFQRSESVRLEMKQDLDRAAERIIREVRSVGRNSGQ